MHRIDYQIALNYITEASETPHQAKQWFIVQQQHAGEIARVRLALHSLAVYDELRITVSATAYPGATS